MGALYRIVQDDHPPIPESVSAIVRDFLMQCFQKDCNLRVSAKKLSKHPWIQMSKKKSSSGSQRSRDKAIPAYEDAVKSVQQWNEAIKGTTTISPGRMSNSKRRSSERGGKSVERTVPAIVEIFHTTRPEDREPFSAPPAQQQKTQRPTSAIGPPAAYLQLGNTSNTPNINVTNPTNVTHSYEPEVYTSNWDDDFADSISSMQLAAAFEGRDQGDEIMKTVRALPSNNRWASDDSDEGHQRHVKESRNNFKLKVAEGKKLAYGKQEAADNKGPSGSLASRSKAIVHAPIDLVRSRSAPGQLALSPPLMSEEFQHYQENEDDGDFSEFLDEYGNDAGSDEEDPFAEVEEGFDEIDLEANIAREKYARISASISEQFKKLEVHCTDKQLEVVCDQLLTLLTENPDVRGPMVANHGTIPLLDLIENCVQQTLILKFLTILNMLIKNDPALQESLCLVGAIPVLIRYTSKRFTKEIQMEAAAFIQQICNSNPMTLQMFISCRGLRTLIEFLQGNYSTKKDLVWIAINGIHSVFNLQSLTPRNDFCRLLAKQGLLDPLSAALYNTIRDPNGASCTEKIVQDLPLPLKVVMLKCIKNISMNSNTLDVLQNASAIHTLVKVLEDYVEGASLCQDVSKDISKEITNYVLTTLFNLCRINKARQEEAALAGIIPHLKQLAESNSPLKQLALPILCDMAHAGRVCRNILWSDGCLQAYVGLFKDNYWQVNAMDSVLIWLQDETVDVEQVLLEPGHINLFVQAFLSAKANSFENILEPLYKIIRLSPSIACGIAVPALFQRLMDRLGHPKAVVRLNLLRILRAIFDAHPTRNLLIDRYGISDVVTRIALTDSAVLVKELANEILDAFAESDSEAALSGNDESDEDEEVEEEEEEEEDFEVERDEDEDTYGQFSSENGVFGSRTPQRPLTVDAVDESDLDPSRGMAMHRRSLSSRSSGKTVVHDTKKYRGGDHFEREVDELDVRDTGMDPMASPRSILAQRRLHGLLQPTTARRNSKYEGGPRTSSSWPTRQRPSDQLSSNIELGAEGSEGSASDDSSEDRFVTGRDWEEDESRRVFHNPGAIHATVQRRVDEDEDSDNDEEDDEPRTVRMVPRQFGHQKSRSLSEVINSISSGSSAAGSSRMGEDLVRTRSNDLESTSSLSQYRTEEFTESMIMRTELPRIRLELFDLDGFPAWNRQHLEAADDGGSDGSGNSDGGGYGEGSYDSRLDEGEGERRTRSPRAAGFNPMVSPEEITKMLEEYHGVRRPSIDGNTHPYGHTGGAASAGRQSTTTRSSSGNSSGTSSGDPTIRGPLRLVGGGIAVSSVESSTWSSIQDYDSLEGGHGILRERMSSQGSVSSVDEQALSEPPKTPTTPHPSGNGGLMLAARQEYDSELQFSDDEFGDEEERIDIFGVQEESSSVDTDHHHPSKAEKSVAIESTPYLETEDPMADKGTIIAMNVSGMHSSQNSDGDGIGDAVNHNAEFSPWKGISRRPSKRGHHRVLRLSEGMGVPPSEEGKGNNSEHEDEAGNGIGSFSMTAFRRRQRVHLKSE
ncbi:hypothetical protein BGW38_002598 [Lunasporangiospora selenospora]|uniref:Protein kinase domain-containing protein n=1 Tax=Lunasporangiospora selenospora TaxID=979761 RepID=A0A9P6FT10_9FUNG|nr:hypothetical protein BGW38_002598 [Lunasporangiospora selenospora]